MQPMQSSLLSCAPNPHLHDAEMGPSKEASNAMFVAYNKHSRWPLLVVVAHPKKDHNQTFGSYS